ncbi:hypothetical protein RRG08_032708 [Elysia crispata]|uniref:Uncharacterized protein n=1 Tax=Elysia crispata TaxID=231223 RepID=A0AAE0YVB2_9GAST|nr:hypothetical protein RRG08_032708 [Elysia crispata]
MKGILNETKLHFTDLPHVDRVSEPRFKCGNLVLRHRVYDDSQRFGETADSRILWLVNLCSHRRALHSLAATAVTLTGHKMESFKGLLPALLVLCCSPLLSAHNTNVWTDILTCVTDLTNGTSGHSVAGQQEATDLRGRANATDDLSATDRSGSKNQQVTHDFSMVRLFSVICGNKDSFVHCLDASLQRSNDSMARLIGSQFDAGLVVKAYDGLCANISAIEDSGADVVTCLTKATLTTCQSEMADYFFYMGVIKKFAPPAEQLSRSTLETLLCSVTAQRRDCELRSVRSCSSRLADVMEEFYRQTRPVSCGQVEVTRLTEQAEPRARP